MSCLCLQYIKIVKAMSWLVVFKYIKACDNDRPLQYIPFHAKVHQNDPNLPSMPQVYTHRDTKLKRRKMLGDNFGIFSDLGTYMHLETLWQVTLVDYNYWRSTNYFLVLFIFKFWVRHSIHSFEWITIYIDLTKCREMYIPLEYKL